MTESQRRASAKYDAANTVQLHLKLNLSTDADILARLDQASAVPGGKQGYIKGLIRSDIHSSHINAKEDCPMKKTIWIARVSDDNSDSCRAYFAKADAHKAAASFKAKLTASELTTHTVSVESYPVDIDDADTRSAEELYRDLLREDDPATLNPDTYIEI